MKIIEIKEEKLWDDFILNSKYVHFLQSWRWGDFESEGLGKKIFRLGFENESGELVGICLVTEEVTRFGKFLYSPRGPIIDWENTGLVEEILDKLKEYFAGSSYFALRLDPAIKNDANDIINLFDVADFRSAVDFVQVERAWMLDIAGKNEDELMAGMRKKARYSLRQAMKSDVSISISDSVEDFEDFLDILECISIRKGFPTVPRQYLLRQFGMLGDFMKFFCAKHKDEVVAGGFFSFYGDESTYLRGAASDSMASSQASYLLQWEAIMHARDLGISRHNFMGVAEEKNYHPGYPAFGYSNFKRGFGGYVEEYMRAKDFVYNMVKYKLLSLNQRYRKFRFRGCN